MAKHEITNDNKKAGTPIFLTHSESFFRSEDWEELKEKLANLFSEVDGLDFDMENSVTVFQHPKRSFQQDREKYIQQRLNS